jgi:catechol 2,3-dioxygenase-like lactoylglutathione lyase family enzyme
MPKHLTGIDHAVIAVRDLDSAGQRFERLGFTLSPRGRHSDHMGTGNYTIMLAEDYFELLGVLAPTPHNERWREGLNRGEGLAAVALRTDDADRACAEIRGLGIAASDVLAFSRPVDMPDGRKAEAAFRITQFPADAVPGLSLFVCGHLTRPAVWIPELMRHANSARGIAEVVAIAANPAAAAEPWARIFGTSSVVEMAGGRSVQVGTHRLALLTPAAIEQRYPGVAVPESSRDRPVGLVFRVADFGAARAALSAGGVTVRDVGGGLVVPPADACGTLIEFRAD